MCGKNENGRRITSFGSGSPPRVREKQLLFLSVRQHHRITPACAGKTPPYGFVGTVTRDHPRVCGKNLTLNISVLDSLGSPPRVREKRVFSSSRNLNTRITPACAGKTRHSYRHTAWTWDHPRVCGKNCQIATFSA